MSLRISKAVENSISCPHSVRRLILWLLYYVSYLIICIYFSPAFSFTPRCAYSVSIYWAIHECSVKFASRSALLRCHMHFGGQRANQSYPSSTYKKGHEILHNWNFNLLQGHLAIEAAVSIRLPQLRPLLLSLCDDTHPRLSPLPPLQTTRG